MGGLSFFLSLICLLLIHDVTLKNRSVQVKPCFEDVRQEVRPVKHDQPIKDCKRPGMATPGPAVSRLGGVSQICNFAV